MTYSSGTPANRESGSNWLTCRVQYLDDTDPFSSTNFPEPTRPPSYTFNVELPLGEQLAGVHRLLKAPHKIDDCTLQLSNTHVYLDLDLSISEQKEEFENFNADGKRNSIIIRTLLSIRVHSCIEKLYNSKGRELRRALFSLKQVFQDDKDLVHQFVEADGLTCLIKVGAEADQNYQNYILRALGQIMLYIDGMEGVVRHKDTIRWLYSLLSSKYRLVVKTALKLLLVFVEYSESNSDVLILAIRHVDTRNDQPTWHNLMNIIKEKDPVDPELLVYAMTLVNKTLSNIPDQDTFYDLTDALEEQKIEDISQYHMKKKGNDVDLLEQFKIYEMSLKHEDGDDDVVDPTSAGSAIKWNRERRKSEVCMERKSKRSNSIAGAISTLLIPETITTETVFEEPNEIVRSSRNKVVDPDKSPKPWEQRLNLNSFQHSNFHITSTDVTNGEISEEREKRRRERLAKWSEREKSYRRQIKPSLEDIYQSERNKLERRRNILNTEMTMKAKLQNGHVNGEVKREENNNEITIPPPLNIPPPPPSRTSTSKILERRRMERKRQEAIKQDEKQLLKGEKPNNNQQISQPSFEEQVIVSRQRRRHSAVPKPAAPTDEIPVMKMLNRETHFPSDQTEIKNLQGRLGSVQNNAIPHETRQSFVENRTDEVITSDQKLLMDMLYSNQSVAAKQTESDEQSDESVMAVNKPGLDMAGNVKALAERLQNSSAICNAHDLPSKSAFKENETLHPRVQDDPPKIITKDSDVMWEKLMTQRIDYKELRIDGFDFSGLSELDDYDCLSPTIPNGHSNAPPPPPPLAGVPPAPPPPPPPPLANGIPLAPPPPRLSPASSPILGRSSSSKRRTIRLFWREASKPSTSTIQNKSNIWSELEKVEVESDYFINLFLLKSKDLTQKKTQNDKRTELHVLDVKRSNAINIGMTILPPPRTIKSAIINMDEFALTKEQIEKLLTMIPTEEEISSIQEAMQNSPDIALGSAEQFLLTLSSISELEARLNLWAFKLDFDGLEKEVAEPLQDLKDGIEEIKCNQTLRKILAVLRSIGNLLNGTSVQGFELTYLGKVPEIKDTVHKQTLLQHLTQCVLEKYPDSSDLYSELGAITRCSRVDFEVLEETLFTMERRCKNSWDNLKSIAKYESKVAFRSKLSEFLMSCARKIIALKIIYSRLKNRFHAMLLYFGTSSKTIHETTIQSFTRMISGFALEYRTAKERVESQKKKRHQRGERNRTRGKTILETQNFSTTEEEMKQKLLENAVRYAGNNVEKRSRSRLNRAGRKSEEFAVTQSIENVLASPTNDDVTEQIMEQLVKSATQTPRDQTAVVNRRRRSRNGQRKSLRRTLKNGLTEEEKATIMKNC